MWIIVLGWNVWEFPAILFGGLGLFGPAIAELILISRTHDKEQWHDYWQRVFDVKRIGKRWLALIFLAFPALHLISIGLSVFAGSSLPEFTTVKSLLSEPLRIFPYLVFMLFFGPLPEELGWRGYALDGLQKKYSALSASLILGVVWALWHLPLFFMKGTFQHDQLRIGTLAFWTYILGPVVLSVLFTWIYNNTNRSTLSAILFHFMINLTAELLPLNEQGRIYSLVLITLWAIAVVNIFGAETLTSRQVKKRGKK